MGIKSMQIKVMTANGYEVQIIPTEELYSKEKAIWTAKQARRSARTN